MTTQLSAIAFTTDIAKLTENFSGRQWVIDDIDRWLQESEERFFILTGEPGVGKSAIAARLTQIRKDIVAYHFCRGEEAETAKPGQILRSLSAQLMNTLPGYGQALLNTVKSPTLTAKVKITYKQASSSQITEICIGNLKTSNESTAGQEDLDCLLEVLIRAPLAALGEYQETVPERAIFLIDGLDVAVSRDEAAQDDEDIVTLLAALSESETLPSWVRFILTSRCDRRVLREFEPLQPHTPKAVAPNGDTQAKAICPRCRYQLDEMSAASQTDIRQYIQQRIQQQPCQTMLLAAKMSVSAFVQALMQQAQGNFRYVCCLLNDLDAGMPPSKILKLPESLKQIYAQEWFAVASNEEFNSILRAIADTEFISEDELVRQTGLRPRLVRQALWGLRQVLDVAAQPESASLETGVNTVETVETFAIFHPSLREYLLPCNLE